MNPDTPRSARRTEAHTGSYQRNPAVRQEVSFLKLMLLASAFLLVLAFCVTLFFW